MTARRLITGLDHTITGVRDLEAARRAYARLGFTLTPRGRHIGWGTANYCIMFPDDYLELLGIVDAARFTNRLDEFLEGGEGLLGLALATDDAAALADWLDARGIAAEGPRDLARLLELPEGSVRPEFKLLHPAPEVLPGLSAFFCQHVTRALMRRPNWLDHANGAAGILAVTALIADLAPIAPAYARLFGAAAVNETVDRVIVETGHGRLEFHRAEDDGRGRPPPCLSGLRLAVADSDRTAHCLAERGVSYDRDEEGALHVPTAEACGVALSFAAAED